MSNATKIDVNYDDTKIIIKSTFDKANIKYVILACPDKLGRLPNCIKRVNSQGDMIMSEKERNDFSEKKAVYFPETQFFTIYSGKVYDLNDMEQAAEWEAVKNCPLIAKSRDARDEKGNLLIDGPISKGPNPGRYGIAELYIDRPGIEVARKVKRKQLVHQAESFILNDELGIEGHLNMARLLGKNMTNQPVADVVDFLLRVAEKDPQKIINLYTGGDTALRLLFIEAKDKKIIYIKNKLYLYGDNIVLGATDDAAIEWMKNPANKKVLDLIRKDTLSEYKPE